MPFIRVRERGGMEVGQAGFRAPTPYLITASDLIDNITIYLLYS